METQHSSAVSDEKHVSENVFEKAKQSKLSPNFKAGQSPLRSSIAELNTFNTKLTTSSSYKSPTKSSTQKYFFTPDSSSSNSKSKQNLYIRNSIGATPTKDNDMFISPTRSSFNSPNSRQIEGHVVSSKRGSFLAPFNFMIQHIEPKEMSGLTLSDLATLRKQLLLLRLLLKKKGDEEKIESENQILRAWMLVNEQEEFLHILEEKVYTANDVVLVHNQIKATEAHMDKALEKLNPLIEKLHAYKSMRESDLDLRMRLKSVKSFNLRTKINQEYAQKILDLERAAKLIERMNENERLFSNKSNIAAVEAPAGGREGGAISPVGREQRKGREQDHTIETSLKK